MWPARIQFRLIGWRANERGRNFPPSGMLRRRSASVYEGSRYNPHLPGWTLARLARHSFCRASLLFLVDDRVYYPPLQPAPPSSTGPPTERTTERQCRLPPSAPPYRRRREGETLISKNTGRLHSRWISTAGLPFSSIAHSQEEPTSPGSRPSFRLLGCPNASILQEPHRQLAS
jgi:hypothetical protein